MVKYFEFFRLMFKMEICRDKTYCVVEFKEDNTLAVVPTKWLADPKTTYWPPFTKFKYLLAAKQCYSPESSWMSYSVKVWKTTDDWKVANKILEELENNSNLETTDGERIDSCKRRSKLPLRYISSSSESRTPSPKKRKSDKQISNKTTFQIPSPPRLLSNGIIQLDTDSELGNEVSGHRFSRILASHSKSSCATVSTPRRSPPNDTRNIFEKDELLPVSSLEPILGNIFGLLSEMKGEIKSLSKEVKLLKKDDRRCNASFLDMFPLNSLEAIIEFERKSLEAQFQEEVVHHLTAFGGRSYSEATRNMLYVMITNDMAKLYNLSGKGASKRRSFKNLKLFQIIFAALRKIFPSVAFKDYRQTVVNWLDGARDRAGGRKNRQKEVRDAIEEKN